MNHIQYELGGMENYEIEKHEVEIENNNSFSKLIFKRENSIDKANLYFKEDAYWEKEKREDYIKNGKKIISKFLLELIKNDISAYGVTISYKGASWPSRERIGNRFVGYGEIVLTSNFEAKAKKIDTVKKINYEDIDSKQERLMAAISIENEVMRFTSLYELLKDKCGSQAKVKELIESKYQNRYSICCENDNKDGDKYGEDNKKQDDFSYLRTLCAHINAEKDDIEVLLREYQERIERDTDKIIKVLMDEYKI